MASCSYDPALGVAINTLWPPGVDAKSDIKRATAVFLLMLPPHRHLASTVAMALSARGVDRKSLGVDLRFRTILKDVAFILDEASGENGSADVYVSLDMQLLSQMAGVPVPDTALGQPQQHRQQQQQQQQHPDENLESNLTNNAEEASMATVDKAQQEAAAPAAPEVANAAGQDHQPELVPDSSATADADLPHLDKQQQPQQQQLPPLQQLATGRQQQPTGKKRKGEHLEPTEKKLHRLRVSAAAAAAITAAGIDMQPSPASASAPAPALPTAAPSGAPTGEVNGNPTVGLRDHLIQALQQQQQQQQPDQAAAATSSSAAAAAADALTAASAAAAHNTEIWRMLGNLFELGTNMIKAGAAPSEVLKLVESAAAAAGPARHLAEGS